MSKSEVDEDREAVMSLFWGQCVQWAASEPDIRKAYAQETGRVPPGGDATADAFARMIDKATGRDDPEHFIVWVTVRFWGLDEAPAKFRERVKWMRENGLLPWMTRQ